MKLSATTLEQALRMLGGNLDFANTPEICLVVCGGASLIAAKVVTRTTKDVDIIAFRKNC